MQNIICLSANQSGSYKVVNKAPEKVFWCFLLNNSGVARCWKTIGAVFSVGDNIF